VGRANPDDLTGQPVAAQSDGALTLR
jgi:hypothetical protein